MVFALRFVTIFHEKCEEETNVLKFGLSRMKWVDTECREAFINQFSVLNPFAANGNCYTLC